MPTVVAERSVACAPPKIWDFVGQMERWAPMLQGYVSHERSSETDSIWTLEGDLGPFTRTVKLAVHISEWKAPERITFELVGIGEDAKGGGSIELLAPTVSAPPPVLAPPRFWWQRLWDWFLGRAPPKLPPVPPPEPSSTRVVFTFRIEAGGPMAPMINALLGPFAEEVANDLVNKVATHLETS